MPVKSELEIKREEKKQFREMLNKLISEKTMDIETIYKLYGKQIDEYKYIYLSLYNGSNYSKIN